MGENIFLIILEVRVVYLVLKFFVPVQRHFHMLLQSRQSNKSITKEAHDQILLSTLSIVGLHNGIEQDAELKWVSLEYYWDQMAAI